MTHSLTIRGTGSALPTHTISNDDLSAFLDTSDEWILSRVGISSRHVMTTETMTQLATDAAQKALDMAGLSPDALALIVCATLGGDTVSPSLACAVAEQLQITCPALDVNGACAGFVYALDAANGYFAAHPEAQAILVIAAEQMSRHADWTDRSTAVLFGDGAGACIVTRGESLRYSRLSTAPNTKILKIPSTTGNSPFVAQPRNWQGLQMVGQDVFRFAVTAVEREVRLACQELGCDLSTIDFFLLHQANKRILDFVMNRLDQPAEKFPQNVHDHGNMSAASVAVLLDEVNRTTPLAGRRLLLCAFGAGMTLGTCVLDWPTT